ncbi:MAG: aminoglycoside phosphotransferase family protein [Candidatus Limnocylindrales bacterium]
MPPELASGCGAEFTSDPSPADASDMMIASGTEAFIYLSNTHWVLRVDRPGANPSARINLAVLDAARNAGLLVPDARIVVLPQGEALEMERLDPKSLTEVLKTHPWAFRAAARTLGLIHFRIHQIPCPASLRPVWEVMPPRLAPMGSSLDSKELAAMMKDICGPQHVLLHGDFNPANLLRRAGSQEWLPVDWNSACYGPPEADVAYTLVMVRSGLAPGRYSHVPSVLLSPVRRLLEHEYLATYLHMGSLDMELLETWAKMWKKAPLRGRRLRS